MSVSVPKVLVLGPITPSSESARLDTLEYPKLEAAVAKHAPHEYSRIRRFWDAEEGSLDEDAEARQLAMQYMLMGSLALTQSANPELWSKRYTQATSEIYGEPDADIAKALWLDRQAGREVEVSFQDAAEKLGVFLDVQYGRVFDALNTTSSTEVITPSEIADRFEAALGVLTEDHDATWSAWTVERNDEKDSLSVVPANKKIIVGMRRANVVPQQLKSLFAHEVLVHGLRGVNGGKTSKELATGLPGYLDAEEGFGVFVEYAVSGEVSEKNIDRYIDIAYALGKIDGHEHTRAELLALAMARAIERNNTAKVKKSPEDIEKEVYAHVNRIYRGSLGNEHVGVFTKDISYHRGFMQMGEYVQAEIDAGKTVEEIFSFLSIGKFDPTNQEHTDYLRSALA